MVFVNLPWKGKDVWYRTEHITKVESMDIEKNSKGSVISVVGDSNGSGNFCELSPDAVLKKIKTSMHCYTDLSWK